MTHVPDNPTTSGQQPANPPGTTRGGARVVFDLDRTVTLEPAEAWARLTDWAGHAEWIPMTRVWVDPDDPARFTAWSGPGPLALEDRMRATSQEFDGATGHCHVDKLGPVLVGSAAFTVAPGPTAGTTVVTWHEDVVVPHLPRFAAPVAAAIGRLLFGWSLGRMAR